MTLGDGRDRDQHHSQPLRPEDLSIPGHEIRVLGPDSYECSCGAKLSDDGVGIHISRVIKDTDPSR